MIDVYTVEVQIKHETGQRDSERWTVGVHKESGEDGRTAADMVNRMIRKTCVDEPQIQITHVSNVCSVNLLSPDAQRNR